MNTEYTHFTIVLDRSGSMGWPKSVWEDTLGGLQTTISEQKKLKDKCTFSLYSFDDKIEQTLNFVDIQSVTDDVNTLGLAPRGGTALYDAIGKAVKETGEKLASLSEKERPGRVVVIIQTDGQENQSKEYKSEAIAAMIKEQEDKYNWQFQFVGSNQQSVLEATSRLGFKGSNTAYYDVGNTKATFDFMNTKLCSTRSVDYNAYMTGETLAFSAAEKATMASKDLTE